MLVKGAMGVITSLLTNLLPSLANIFSKGGFQYSHTVNCFLWRLKTKGTVCFFLRSDFIYSDQRLRRLKRYATTNSSSEYIEWTQPSLF